MSQPARQPTNQRPVPGAWHNPLPGWILASAAYKSLSADRRHALQVIANKCDQPDVEGNLMHPFGLGDGGAGELLECILSRCASRSNTDEIL